MDAEVKDNGDAARYELRIDGELAGFVDYRHLSETLVELSHTEIVTTRERKGLGSTMVRTVLDDIRQAGSRVYPSCGFIAGYIRRHPEYKDLVPEAHQGLVEESR